MLEAAALGVAVLQEEDAAVEALMAADVVVPHILAALNLLLWPQRLIATLSQALTSRANYSIELARVF